MSPPADRTSDGTERLIHGGAAHGRGGQSRRAVLASVPAIFAGCAGLGSTPTPTEWPDSDDDGVPDGPDDYPNDPRRALESSYSEGSSTLRPGEYASGIALTNHPEASGDVLHYEVSVDGDAPVDCLVFRREAWDAYVDGDRDVPVVDEYSRVDVTEANVTVGLGEGEFLFTVDYTDMLTAPGSDSVDVHRVVEIAEPPSSRESDADTAAGVDADYRGG